MASKGDDSVSRKGTGPLTARQAQFVAEYIIDLNQAQAAIRAGFSPRSARSCAARMMTFANVAAAISEAKRSRAKATGITQDRVLEELGLLAFSDVGHYELDPETGKFKAAADAPAGARRAISSIKYRRIVDSEGTVTYEAEVKLWDKPGPLKLAGRHVGLFPDRVEVSGPNGGPLEIRSAKDLSSGERRKRIAELASKRAPRG